MTISTKSASWKLTVKITAHSFQSLRSMWLTAAEHVDKAKSFSDLGHLYTDGACCTWRVEAECSLQETIADLRAEADRLEATLKAE